MVHRSAQRRCGYGYRNPTFLLWFDTPWFAPSTAPAHRAGEASLEIPPPESPPTSSSRVDVAYEELNGVIPMTRERIDRSPPTANDDATASANDDDSNRANCAQ